MTGGIAKTLICGLLGLILAFGAQGAGLLRSLEWQSWNARVRLLARPSPFTEHIRIIELDQSSLDWGARENGLSWPWPREVYGLILDFCRRAGAAALSLDVLFSESSLYGVEDDRALALAGLDNGRLILSFVLGEGQSASWPGQVPELPVDWRLGDMPPGHAYSRAGFPTPELLSGASALGMVNQLPDADGIFRALTPLAFFDGKPAPSLALAAYLLNRPGSQVSRLNSSTLLIRSAAAATEDSAGTLSAWRETRISLDAPLELGGRAILNFRGRSGTHAAFSAAAVIQSELRLREGLEPVIAPEELRGRHVLFGFTAPALLDLRPSPTDGSFAGVELHATALDNLLAGDFISPVPSWLTFVLAGILSLAAAFSALRSKRLAQLLILVPAFLVAPPALSMAAYRASFQLPLAPILLAIFLSLTLSILLAYATEGRQRRFLKSAFSQYLSPEVISQIIQEPGRLKLGGERRLLSIFFSDLESFSAISERLAPEDLTMLLNEYLSLMSDIILEEGGTIDKYEGDAIIAFWNAPQEQADHAARALRAALRCQEALEARRTRFQSLAGRPLVMRIGLNTGPAVVGNLGSRSRFDYTMLGDAVNLASRLEGVNKVFGTRIIVSQAAFEAAGALDLRKKPLQDTEFTGRDLGLLRVVGRQEGVRVFEPLRPAEAEARAGLLENFAVALCCFQAGDLSAARTLFVPLAAEDPPSAAYLRRCLEIMETGLLAAPDADWTGVWELSAK
ncbi:MAG: adenylate/guanylate cyclase domain-containing protein [Desulfovibrionaceae bacterium]|nr:adenylate/guanylate cyclase domain-containing protein [Desulfovibrionaceae bacterium]